MKEHGLDHYEHLFNKWRDTSPCKDEHNYEAFRYGWQVCVKCGAVQNLNLPERRKGERRAS